MTNLEINMSVSEMMETPAGVPTFFAIQVIGNEKFWDRNEQGSMFEFETTEQFLKSGAYQIAAGMEILFYSPVKVRHWNFIYS